MYTFPLNPPIRQLLIISIVKDDKLLMRNIVLKWEDLSQLYDHYLRQQLEVVLHCTSL